MKTIPIRAWTSNEVKDALKKVITKPTYGSEICMGDYFEGSEYDFEEPMKWYERDKEMIALSQFCPNIIFILEGQGEETGDWWRNSYFRGERRRVEAYLPELNMSDWEAKL
jgi:hypothetical protein